MTARRPHPLVAQLAAERAALDLNRPQVAELAGVSVRALNAVETGTCNPSLTTLDLMARALGFRVALIHIGEKPCRECGQVKPIRLFNTDGRTSDGLATACATCRPRPVATSTDTEVVRRARPYNLTKAGALKGRQAVNAARAAARDARLGHFSDLRGQGLSVEEAAIRLQIHRETARRYERRRTEVAA